MRGCLWSSFVTFYKARQTPAVLVLAAFVTLWGWPPVTHSDPATALRLTTAPGVSAPRLDLLARQLEGMRGGRLEMRTVVREEGKVVEVTRPRATTPRSAVVRSFDATTGRAYVHLIEYPKYPMPLLQLWHFDGQAWSDSVDPGIFIGGRHASR